VSAELENATPTSASAVIGAVLSSATSKSLDAVAFGTAAATADQPAGLLNGVTPLVASTASGIAGMSEDIGAMARALVTANIDPANMVIVAPQRQAVALQIQAGPRFDYPILPTAALADGTVAAFAPGAVASATDGAPAIEASKESAIHFEDTTPLPIGTPGTPNTVAAPTRSAFQSDILVLRCRAFADWRMIASGGVQVQ